MKPKYTKGMRLWWDGINQNGELREEVCRVFVNEVWWGGRNGSSRFFIPKFYEGQKVRLKDYNDITTIESTHNWKSTWECDRSDMEHGGSIVYFEEPRYDCKNNWISGNFEQSELEALDDTKPTEKDILYDVQINEYSYILIREPNLYVTEEDAENSRATIHEINSLNKEYYSYD